MKRERLGNVILIVVMFVTICNLMFASVAPDEYTSWCLLGFVVCLIGHFVGYLTKYGFNWKNFLEIF